MYSVALPRLPSSDRTASAAWPIYYNYCTAIDRSFRLANGMGGNWYATDEPPMEGWLCLALFRYFDMEPPELYVKAEEKK